MRFEGEILHRYKLGLKILFLICIFPWLSLENLLYKVWQSILLHILSRWWGRKNTFIWIKLIFKDLVLAQVDSTWDCLHLTPPGCFSTECLLIAALSTVAVPFLCAKNLYTRSILIQVLITIGSALTLHTIHSKI